MSVFLAWRGFLLCGVNVNSANIIHHHAFSTRQKKIYAFFNNLLVVNGTVLVEIKSVKTLTLEYESKLIHYLKATGIEVGLLLNFGESVEVRRKIYTNERRPSA